jgi:hypothetical protein
MTAEVPGVKSPEETVVHVEEAEDVTEYIRHTPDPPERAAADGDETIVKPLNKHTP